MINPEADGPKRVQDLHDMIDGEISDAIRQAQAGGWTVEEALLAINDVVKARWLNRNPATDGPKSGSTMISHRISMSSEGEPDSRH